MIGRLEPSDVIVTEADWREYVQRNIEVIARGRDDCSRPEQKGSAVDGNAVTESGSLEQMDTSQTQSSTQESEDQFFTASEFSGNLEAEVGAADSSEEDSSPSMGVRPGGGKGGGSHPISSRPPKRPLLGTGRQSKKASATACKRKGKKEWTEKKQKKLQDLEVSSGTYVGELIFARSYLDILWQDGRLEQRVPSTRVQYSEMDLDMVRLGYSEFITVLFYLPII